MHYTKADLEAHIAAEHRMSPFAAYLKEIVYGGSDGIITTFAVVGGFVGASHGGSIVPLGYMAVLLFGFANLFADGVSMALGNILAIRSEQDRFGKEWRREMQEIRENTPLEKAETVQLLKMQGFHADDAQQLVEIYAKNPEYWANFMMKYELEMEDPRGENPILTGLATFISFVSFGLIPLLPYVFFGTDPRVFLYAGLSTLLALVLLGLLRFRVTKDSLVRAVGEIVFLGSISASVAYFVGTFFRI